MRRSEQRRDAVFALYQREVTGRPLDEMLVGAKPFTRELAVGTEERRAELDEAIASHAEGWTVDRIAPLERSIMRVALYEAAYRDDVPTEVERLAERLRDVAGQLHDPELAEDRVEELAREAAELAAQAGSEAEAALRDSA